MLCQQFYQSLFGFRTQCAAKRIAVISHQKACADSGKTVQRPGNILHRYSSLRIGGQLDYAQVQALDDLECSEIRRRLDQDDVSGTATCSKGQVDRFRCANCHDEIVRPEKAPAF